MKHIMCRKITWPIASILKHIDRILKMFSHENGYIRSAFIYQNRALFDISNTVILSWKQD
jgi:hypothetical protein